MKVYIRLGEKEYFNDMPDLNSLAETAMYHITTKWKYKIMWNLRSLEKKIAEENGIIIVNETGRIETKNFTKELTDEIMGLLKTMSDD
jgi:DNA-binding HxlR family transcriptional regulator